MFHLTVLIFLFWPYLPRAIQAQQGEQAQPGTFQVNISKDYLSLIAQEAPLPAVFQEIGKQAGIPIDFNIAPEEKITIRLDGVPIDAGIRQLAKNVTVFHVEDSKNKTRRIARVVVLSDGKDGASGRTQSPSKPAHPSEPSGQSEPFKFELDPGKFAEKQRPRKQQ
jgi:hypothetical protein